MACRRQSPLEGEAAGEGELGAIVDGVLGQLVDDQPEQVVGSSGVVQFTIAPDNKTSLQKLPKIEFIDDGPGKPVGINRFIGRRPIFSFGNSDGDLQMLQWTTAGAGARGPKRALGDRGGDSDLARR